MDIRNCSRCGRLYHYDGFRICPTCRREDEADFTKVKEYLYKNPGADISEVEKETEVEASKIIEFLRQGRLEVAEDSNLVLECEICGTSIRTGRFCDKCASDLQKELSLSIKGTGKKPVQREKERFRVIDRYEKRR
ncbi:MAG: MerR family transcriptional regulator [Tissierellaceae bacterium]|nr:MerR family transcriptional regulator [Tissierellaceae bacterium]